MFLLGVVVDIDVFVACGMNSSATLKTNSQALFLVDFLHKSQCGIVYKFSIMFPHILLVSVSLVSNSLTILDIDIVLSNGMLLICTRPESMPKQNRNSTYWKTR